MTTSLGSGDQAGAHAEAREASGRAVVAERPLHADPTRRAETLEMAVEAAGLSGHWNAALAYQEELIALIGENGDACRHNRAPALVKLAYFANRLNLPAKAEAALRAAIAARPDLRLAKTSLIDLLFRQGRDAEAFALGEEAYRNGPLTLERRADDDFGTLLLLRSLRGNVPERHLLARLKLTLVSWQIAYSDEVAGGPPVHYDLAFNLIGDADAGGEALPRAASFATHCRLPPLNDPVRVLRTRRDAMPDLLGGIEGLVVPRVARVAAVELRRGSDTLARHGLRLPVIVRATGRHGGEDVRLCETVEMLDAESETAGSDVYLTEYHDCASSDGYFRKYRVIFVDRRVFPYHLAISKRWMVHYFSADMAEGWTCDEEMSFLEQMQGTLGPLAVGVLEQVAHRLDLDYAGADFTLLPDGRVLLFETNATMLVHPEDAAGPLARKNPFVQKILAAFDEMVIDRLRRAQLRADGRVHGAGVRPSG